MTWWGCVVSPGGAAGLVTTRSLIPTAHTLTGSLAGCGRVLMGRHHVTDRP